MLFNSYSYEILYEQFHWIYLQGDIKLLLVTVNNRLKFEIEIVHDLSCHPIVSWINLPQNHVNVFPLTWIMSLHYLVKLEMLVAHMLPPSVKESNSIIYLASAVVFLICQIWIQLITACRNIAREGVQNTHRWSGSIDDATDEWLLQWQRDPAWPTPLLVAVSVYPDQRWVLWTLSLTICRTLRNQLDSNMENLEATIKVE